MVKLLALVIHSGQRQLIAYNEFQSTTDECLQISERESITRHVTEAIVCDSIDGLVETEAHCWPVHTEWRRR